MSESDFVSTVSARLIAARLPRSQRLGALRLLGALDTPPDPGDRGRRPLRQGGTEFDLPPGEVDSWFDALESVGAVVVDEGGIVLMGREEPVGSMRLHDFLAVVAELDERPARRRLPALITPAAAVLVAAAVIAAVVLSPGVVLNGPTTARSSLAAP